MLSRPICAEIEIVKKVADFIQKYTFIIPQNLQVFCKFQFFILAFLKTSWGLLSIYYLIIEKIRQRNICFSWHNDIVITQYNTQIQNLLYRSIYLFYYPITCYFQKSTTSFTMLFIYKVWNQFFFRKFHGIIQFWVNNILNTMQLFVFNDCYELK